MNSCCVPNVIYFSSLILLFSYSFGFHWTPRSHSAKFISFTLNEDDCILCFAAVVHNIYRGVCKSSFTMPFKYACVCDCERVRSDAMWSGVVVGCGWMRIFQLGLLLFFKIPLSWLDDTCTLLHSPLIRLLSPALLLNHCICIHSE